MKTPESPNISLEPGDIESTVPRSSLEHLSVYSESIFNNPGRSNINLSEVPTPWMGRVGGQVRRFCARKKIRPRPKEIRVLANCPEGYPHLAAFLDSDENFMLYRRFGFLQARILLNKQDELRELEVKLDYMDSMSTPEVLQSRGIDVYKSDNRKNLLVTIEKKFKEYVDLLVTAQTIAGFNRAPKRDYNSVKNYFDKYEPVCISECYISYKEDLITLKPGREGAWLDTMIAKLILALPRRCTSPFFQSKGLSQKAGRDSKVVLINRERMGLVVSMIITVVILALLIVPIYVLFRLTSEGQPRDHIVVLIMVLLVFTLTFSLVLYLFTKAKRHEILAAAAAYCAVLVVFIGNVGQLSDRSTN